MCSVGIKIDASDERASLIQRSNSYASCAYCTVLVACPLVLGIVGCVSGIACFWVAPHSCSNFPIPAKSDGDLFALPANMWLSPLIMGAGGAAVGGIFDGLLYGANRLLKKHGSSQSQQVNKV
jgi:hypothetical protein